MEFEDWFLSNSLSSVSIGVFNIGKSKVKENWGGEIIDVDFGEGNCTVGSAEYILTEVSFDTVASKLLDVVVKNIFFSVLIVISFLL